MLLLSVFSVLAGPYNASNKHFRINPAKACMLPQNMPPNSGPAHPLQPRRSVAGTRAPGAPGLLPHG